ncbi:hypothetical protein PAMH19_1372 [Pseudomonas aeruginosa]|nr:hypothetical protein PAMH19_1372 [Pseudomonas aeruginosa]
MAGSCQCDLRRHRRCPACRQGDHRPAVAATELRRRPRRAELDHVRLSVRRRIRRHRRRPPGASLGRSPAADRWAGDSRRGQPARCVDAGLRLVACHSLRRGARFPHRGSGGARRVAQDHQRDAAQRGVRSVEHLHGRRNRPLDAVRAAARGLARRLATERTAGTGRGAAAAAQRPCRRWAQGGRREAGRSWHVAQGSGDHPAGARLHHLQPAVLRPDDVPPRVPHAAPGRRPGDCGTHRRGHRRGERPGQCRGGLHPFPRHTSRRLAGEHRDPDGTHRCGVLPCRDAGTPGDCAGVRLLGGRRHAPHHRAGDRAAGLARAFADATGHRLGNAGQLPGAGDRPLADRPDRQPFRLVGRDRPDAGRGRGGGRPGVLPAACAGRPASRHCHGFRGSPRGLEEKPASCRAGSRATIRPAHWFGTGGQRPPPSLGSVVAGEHFQQFDLEQQVGVGLDVRADLPFAVGQVGRDEQPSLATDLHAHQALVPTLDHSSGADHALEWPAALVGGVEQRAVFQGALVLGGDQRTLHYLLAVAQEEVFDLQSVVHGAVPARFAESRDSASKRAACRRADGSGHCQAVRGTGIMPAPFRREGYRVPRCRAHRGWTHISGIIREHIRMQRLSRIGRNTLAVSVSTLLLSACNQGDDAPKPAAVAPQPAAPSMAALSIPLCLNGQCAVIDQDAKLLVPFDNDYDNIVASAYQGTLMAAREERWNLIQAKDGKVLRDDIGEALSLLSPNLYGFVRDGKYGVVDGQGKEVQAPRFDDIYPNSANEFIIYEIDGKRGILDAKGKQLTEALYDTTLVNGSVAEHGGLISAERGEEKWIINLATGEQKAVAYESLGDLHDGVMSASVIGKGSQLVDAKGDVVGDGKSYDYLGTPANGLVAFREKYDSPCGYLDYQGKVAIAAQFAGCGAFGKQGGLAQQRMEDGSSGKYGLIDRSGAWKVQPQYDSADSAGLTALGYTVDVPGLAAVGVSTGLFSADFGIFNLDEGSEWVKPGYAQIGALGNDLFVVAKKGGPQKTVSFMGSESQVPVVGLMDRSGKMLLEPGELISIQSAYDGRFLEALDGMDNAAHTVLLDRQGRTLVPALWQKLEVNPQQGYILGYEVSGTGDEATETLRALYDLNGKPRFTVATTDCGAEQLLDGNGKAIWPQDPTPYCQSDEEQGDEGEPEQEPAEESEETSES